MAIGGVLTAAWSRRSTRTARSTRRRSSACSGTWPRTARTAWWWPGTTGEGSTLTDEEKLRLFQLAADEGGDLFIVAGTGSNDTAPRVHLSEQANEIDGVDALLAVTPYYNKPPLRGVYAHYEAISQAVDKPVIALQHPEPGRDRPAERLPALRWREIENVAARQAVALQGHRARSTASTCWRATTTRSPRCSTPAAPAASSTCSPFVGTEMRRMIDEPENRAADPAGPAGPDRGASRSRQLSMTVKAGLNLLGLEVGGVRLPLVEADEDEVAQIRERPRAPRAAERGLSGKLRVLPLGGLGRSART